MSYIVVNGVVIHIKEEAEKAEMLRSLREEAVS